MTTRSLGGYLVGTAHALPTDPTDFNVENLPVVGCTRLRCRQCQVRVRSAVSDPIRAVMTPQVTD